MGFLAIGCDLHNTLCTFAFAMLALLSTVWIWGRIRRIERNYSIVTSNNQRNVLILDSEPLNELREVLHRIHRHISLNPGQIRRILRTALDENIVKTVQSSTPDIHISPQFTNTMNGCRLNWTYCALPNLRIHNLLSHQSQNALQSSLIDDDTNSDSHSGSSGRICFDFYWGVSASYIDDLSVISGAVYRRNKRPKKQRKKIRSFSQSYGFQPPTFKRLASKSLTTTDETAQLPPQPPISDNSGDLITLQTESNKLSGGGGDGGESMKSPLYSAAVGTHQTTDSQSSDALSTAPLTSTQAHSDAHSGNAGGSTITATEMTTINLDESHQRFTIDKVRPTNYIKHDFIETKDDSPIDFEYSELEGLISMMDGTDIVSSRFGRLKTKLKNRATSAVASQSDPSTQSTSTNADGKPTKKDAQHFFCVLLSYIQYDSPPHSQLLNETDTAVNIDKSGFCYDDLLTHLEINIFAMPQQSNPTNNSGDTNTTTANIKATASAEASSDEQKSSVENRSNYEINPRLHSQILVDFTLQKMRSYHDIFGLDSWKSSADDSSLGDCKICFSAPSTIVLLPCRHCCVCYDCFTQIEKCPMCRRGIKQSLRWSKPDSIEDTNPEIEIHTLDTVQSTL